MPNNTNIPAPRVPFIDQRTGLMSREWYRFFFNQFTLLAEAGGAQHNSLSGLQGGTTGQYYHLTQAEYVGTGSGVFVRADSPVLFGSTTISGPLTLGSTLSGVDASFTGSLSAGSGTFTGALNATTGAFTDTITGTTLTLSGLATFNAGATGTDAAFTTATIGGLSYNVEDISSTGAGGNPGQLSFYTRDLDNLVSVQALNLDNQQRLNFYGPATDIDGTPPDLSLPINYYQQSRTYRDIQTFIGGTNTYGVSNYYGENTLRALRTGVTYTYGVSVWVNGAIVEGTNVTISEKLALVTAADNVNFANAFYVGSGSGSVATSNALGAFVSQGVLGYGPDAFANSPGGAVTQLTSKSTGVTLDKGCGAITMNAAALAAGASVEFVLTNSFIAAFDTVICNMGPGGTASTYLVQCQAVAAGSCRFRVTNYSGTSRSEACVVNFAIIKATNA